MKLKNICIILFTIFSVNVLAQDTLQVNETEKLFNTGKHPAFTIQIPQAKLKTVISDWKKYVRKKNKSSFSETDGEYSINKILIPEIGNDSFFVSTIFDGGTNNINLTSTFSKMDSTYISSSTDAETSVKISTYIRNFAVDQYRNAVGDELELEKKKLVLLNDNLKDLENTNDRNEKKIKENNRENDRNKEDLKVNLQQQEINTTAILQQQQVVGTFLTSSDLKNAEDKKLKDLQKQKRNFEKDNESLHKKTEGNDDEIKELQKAIDKNNSETIPSKKNEIELQKKTIENVEVKMRAIR